MTEELIDVEEQKEGDFKLDPELVVPNDQIAAALQQAANWEKVARTENAIRKQYEDVLTIAQKKRLGLLPPNKKPPSKAPSKRPKRKK